MVTLWLLDVCVSSAYRLFSSLFNVSKKHPKAAQSVFISIRPLSHFHDTFRVILPLVKVYSTVIELHKGKQVA